MPHFNAIEDAATEGKRVILSGSHPSKLGGTGKFGDPNGKVSKQEFMDFMGAEFDGLQGSAVNPSGLAGGFACARTLASVWRNERQNQ
jgi:hypothetical protein